ncbi:two-component system, cell cycle sensor histidine kinase and response regulator CckA [Mariprofundus micogutta]|uniref:histidine kinase n=1 Tax=Mariprofundus micogutta TaxID=1921010 RepID=A0A1L8CK62_9PROT|nr:bacteriohemerythrin [Mariprofundus micogutta]GAV19249.1 two-component system, cell cycle sensor histidine kinase and response regulator CckA [Mariprofundus micogutta]
MPDNTIEFFEVFPWNENFATGIAEIDEQHKQLVHLLNKLAAHLAHRSDPVALNKVFGELAAYADHHFKTEEGIWDPYFKDDPWCSSHHKTHESFMVNVGKLKEEENTKPLDEVIEDILKFLTHWLAYHILDSDKRMAKAVLAIDSGLSLEQAKVHADHEMSGSMKLLIDTVLAMYDSLSSRTLDLMKEKAERKRIEQALRESEKQEKSFSDAVMNIVPGMLYLIDEDLRLIRWNKKLNELTGYSNEELVDKRALDFFHPDSHQAITEAITTVFTEGSAEIEEQLYTRNGARTPCLFTAVLLEVNGKKHISGIGIEISDRKRAEEALLKSQEQFYQAQKMEAVGTLVGGIAHDFNNMLAGITGNLYLAKKRTREMPDVVQKLSDVEELSFRASDMIQQLLTFARKGEVSMKPMPLNPFIKETLKFLRTSIPENIEIRQDISGDSMQIIGNVTQLHQVLMNLINNARDAVKDTSNPFIGIKLEKFQADNAFVAEKNYFNPGAYAHLSIEDNGCGIAEHDHQHLFEPFFSTKEQGEGTGLGLAMVFGAVKTHQGFIEADSTEGNGSTFHVYIPIQQEHRQVSPEPSTARVTEGNGETILIVDDEEIVRRSNSEILESINYNVRVASNGLEAVEIIANNPNEITLILIDIVMPKLGGKEAIEQIRKIQPDIKVIFSTGYDKDKALRHEALPAGTALLSKPHTIQKLSETIKSLLES